MFTRTYNSTPTVLVSVNHSTTVSGNSAPIHNGITAWIEVKVSERHNIILGSTKVPTDKLTGLLCMICENSEVPFLTLYSVFFFFLQVDVIDPLAFISVYNKSNKKI